MRKLAFLLALLCASPAFATQRSYAAKAEFKRMNPCPANDQRRGPCPGYEVDHVLSLKCGGPDDYTNMQWLTVSDHRAKTAREASLCRPSRRSASP